MSEAAFTEFWSTESLGNTLARALGAGADADLPEALRFARQASILAKTRFEAEGEQPSEQPVVFLLHPLDPPALEPERARSKRLPMLDDGRHSITGRIWFVNEVVNEGVSVELKNDEDDADIWTLLKDVFEVGHVPALVVTNRSGQFQARFFPDGIGSSKCHRTDLSRVSVGLAEVREALDAIYMTDLRTPEAQGSVVTTWQDASKLVPVHQAELTVQKILKVGLTQRFLGSFQVLEEQPAPSGRFDLLIESFDVTDRTSTTKEVLLELKVLRAKHHSGTLVQPNENRRAIRKGLKQAAVYRDERHVRSVALCCYDMRADVVGDAMFAEFVRKATKRRVELWSWHLFPNSEQWREFAEPDEVDGDDMEGVAP